MTEALFDSNQGVCTGVMVSFVIIMKQLLSIINLNCCKSTVLSSK